MGKKGKDQTGEEDIRGYSSAGRAPALQAGGQRFEPAYLHQPARDGINRGNPEDIDDAKASGAAH